MLIETIHYPLLRTLTISELCHRYDSAQKQYWRSRKLFVRHGCNEVGMTVYAEYAKALWDEINRRSDDEMEIELCEKICAELLNY